MDSHPLAFSGPSSIVGPPSVGSLSGGCVEEDFLARLAAGAFRAPVQVIAYGDGADAIGASRVSLPCGGRLEVLELRGLTLDQEPESAMDAVLKNITAIVGAGNVLTGDDVGARRVDWLTGTPCRAGAIVRPGSTKELAAVMCACHAANQPVVIHGGLTGLVHGAEAAPEELAISLERMTAIEAVDPVGGTLTVQAGAPLQRVQEAAADSGMHFTLDLGARGSCTIGGNIATNAGGIRVIRHGMMRDQVLGLEAVLADGTVVSAMNRMLKNNAGYDLKQLFIGSEGTLGIITRAVLRLQPQQSATQTAMVSCDDFRALTGLLQHMRHTLGEQLVAFEVMWCNHYALLTDESGRHSPPLPPDAAYYVLIEALGHHHAETTQRFEAAIETAFDEALLTNAVVAISEHQRRRLWAIREDIEGLLHHLTPPLYLRYQPAHP